jgi:hypothetical protein
VTNLRTFAKAPKIDGVHTRFGIIYADILLIDVLQVIKGG